MAWMKIETAVARNLKFMRAGPAPAWLWICGLAYCQEGLTDGFIPEEALDYLGVKNARRLVEFLVKARLWEVVEGGWQVHDYLEHNKSAVEVLGIKRERRESGAKGGAASGAARRRSDALKQRAEANAKQVASANAKQPSNPSTDTATATDTATDTEAFASPSARRAPLHDRSHRQHAHCGRVCLHASLFGEFVRRRNHPDAETEIREWAMEVEREWGTDGPRGHVETGDAFDFWRARYADRWPAQERGTSRKPGQVYIPSKDPTDAERLLASVCHHEPRCTSLAEHRDKAA